MGLKLKGSSFSALWTAALPNNKQHVFFINLSLATLLCPDLFAPDVGNYRVANNFFRWPQERGHRDQALLLRFLRDHWDKSNQGHDGIANVLQNQVQARHENQRD